MDDTNEKTDSNPIIISGLWIRSNEDYNGVEVLLEVPQVDGKKRWRLCWSEVFRNGNVISHRLDPLKIRNSPMD